MTVTPKSRPLTRQAAELQEEQRKKWREEKRTQRQLWTSQKWRRHREKCVRYNRKRREETRMLTAASQAHPEAAGDGESFTPKSPSCNVYSPSPTKLKIAYKSALHDAKRHRSKESLARRRLLTSLLNPELDADTKNLYQRKKASEVSCAAREFLEDSAAHVPGKQTISKRTGVQKKILPKRLKRLHKEFLQKNPGSQISLRTLYRIMPKHILSSKRLKFNQCLCEVCANIDLKLDALNRHLEDPVDGRDLLSEASLCAGEPQQSCLDRQCLNCGVAQARARCQLKTDSQGDALTKWRSWKIVDTPRGKRRELVTEEGLIERLLDKLMEELQPFSRHLANFRWQYQQFRTLKCNLPPTWALVVMDFAENFLCKYQNKVQSIYWFYNQVTVHPCVLHYACKD
ncbi:uncharacterized protein LOC106174215, partial [Lingula anatina]|uniref:Uncharacterized protein LOC106174215 n=1 Tax=Lingula anatina TaxID=7574 RepID=A0A1S3JMG8_LINAN